MIQEQLKAICEQIEKRWYGTVAAFNIAKENREFMNEEGLDAVIDVYNVAEKDNQEILDFSVNIVKKLPKESNYFVAIIPHDKEATRKFYQKKVTEMLANKKA